MNNQFARILLLEKDQAQVLLTIEWEGDHYQLLIRSECNGVAMSTQLDVADRQTALTIMAAYTQEKAQHSIACPVHSPRKCLYIHTMNEDTTQRLYQVASVVEELIDALEQPHADSIHLKRLQGDLPGLRDELRALYRQETGQNPWPKSPDDIQDDQLDTLTHRFISTDCYVDDFAEFWNQFIGTVPSLDKVMLVIELLHAWGYVIPATKPC